MFFFLDIAVVNSYIVYKTTENDPVSHLDFRLGLAKQLISNFCSRSQAGRPRVRPVVAEITHFSEKMEEGGKPKECRNCQQKWKRLKAANRPAKRPPESKFGCKACCVYLCRDGCFKEFHDMANT